MIVTEHVDFQTNGNAEMKDLTAKVAAAVERSELRAGVAVVFVSGATAAVTTIEYEPGVLSDLSRALAVIAPDDIPYAHDAAWGDGNGRSHVRAAIVGPSLTVPVIGGRLACGTWQQIVLIELDVKASRRRTVHVTVHD